MFTSCRPLALRGEEESGVEAFLLPSWAQSGLCWEPGLCLSFWLPGTSPPASGTLLPSWPCIPKGDTRNALAQLPVARVQACDLGLANQVPLLQASKWKDTTGQHKRCERPQLWNPGIEDPGTGLKWGTCSQRMPWRGHIVDSEPTRVTLTRSRVTVGELWKWLSGNRRTCLQNQGLGDVLIVRFGPRWLLRF